MEEFRKHLYVILFPNEALVASELEPEAFGRHYAVGSPRHFSGKVIFAEVDINFRHPYFNIDAYLQQTTTGKPGVPKKTKFVKSYRVLEHVELNAFKDLYLVTEDGWVLPLQKTTDSGAMGHHAKGIRIYQELCPLRPLVASNYSPLDFGYYMTSVAENKGAPKLFFTEIAVNVDDLLTREEPLLHSPLPNIHPGHLLSSLKELKEKPDKRTKTISLKSIFDDIGYHRIKNGYWIMAGREVVYYPMPEEAEIEEKHYNWWKSVYQPFKE